LAQRWLCWALLRAHSNLINAGNAVSGTDATGQWWTFGLGLALIIILAVTMSSGTKASFRVQNVCWIIASVGTFLAFVALLIASRADFTANFNTFARPFTHNANSYQAIQDAAAKTGFTFTGNHPFASTLPVVAIIMTFMMWNWWSVYIAGEPQICWQSTTPIIRDDWCAGVGYALYGHRRVAALPQRR